MVNIVSKGGSHTKGIIATGVKGNNYNGLPLLQFSLIFVLIFTGNCKQNNFILLVQPLVEFYANSRCEPYGLLAIWKQNPP